MQWEKKKQGAKNEKSMLSRKMEETSGTQAKLEQNDTNHC